MAKVKGPGPMPTDTRERSEWVMVLLREQNPRTSPVELSLWRDAAVSYLEARDNIREHGEIVQHPRTGAPIANPYAGVRDKAMAALGRMTRIRAAGVLE